MTRPDRPAPLPAAGGSYIRGADGSLKPAAAAAKPAATAVSAPKPAPKSKES